MKICQILNHLLFLPFVQTVFQEPQYLNLLLLIISVVYLAYQCLRKIGAFFSEKEVVIEEFIGEYVKPFFYEISTFILSLVLFTWFFVFIVINFTAILLPFRYDDKGRYHGFSHIHFSNDDVYEGETHHGLLQGIGKYRHGQSGDQKYGIFKDSHLVDLSIETQSKGNYYYGHFLQGKPFKAGVSSRKVELNRTLSSRKLGSSPLHRHNGGIVISLSSQHPNTGVLFTPDGSVLFLSWVQLNSYEIVAPLNGLQLFLLGWESDVSNNVISFTNSGKKILISPYFTWFYFFPWK